MEDWGSQLRFLIGLYRVGDRQASVHWAGTALKAGGGGGGENPADGREQGSGRCGVVGCVTEQWTVLCRGGTSVSSYRTLLFFSFLVFI